MPLPLPVIPMPFTDFRTMEHRLGWKHEYWDGAARLSPQESAVVSLRRITSTAVVAAALPAGLELRLVTHDDETALTALFLTTFDDAIEYAGWPDHIYRRKAGDTIRSFFGSPVAHPHLHSDAARSECSFVIATRSHLVAAALVRSIRSGPILQPIFVAESHRRCGLATALLSAVVQALQRAGDETLFSHCQLGNLASLVWHERNGFVELPNYFVAQHRHRHFAQLADHYRNLSHTDAADEAKRLADHWHSIVLQLEKLDDHWRLGLLD